MAAPLHAIDVAAGIVWRDGRFLAARRPAGKPHAGYWEFPGGKLEPGEDAAQALARELFEELDIRVRSATFWRRAEHAYPERGLHVRLHFFHVTAFDGSPRSLEGQALRWILPQEARSLPFLPADAAIVTALGQQSGGA